MIMGSWQPIFNFRGCFKWCLVVELRKLFELRHRRCLYVFPAMKDTNCGTWFVEFITSTLYGSWERYDGPASDKAVQPPPEWTCHSSNNYTIPSSALLVSFPCERRRRRAKHSLYICCGFLYLYTRLCNLEMSHPRNRHVATYVVIVFLRLDRISLSICRTLVNRYVDLVFLIFQ